MIELITIIGPTASGKTLLANELASVLQGEIISADSRQVYKRMDLGTGKDLSDYWVNGRAIPYHLIDIHEPGYKYNVSEYQHDFWRVFTEMRQKGVQPILCGGSGMYVEAVLAGYKLQGVQPPPIDSMIVGVDIERELRRKKISDRLEKRFAEGMLDEVQGLLDEGVPAEHLIYYGLEYKFMTLHLIGQLSYDEMYKGLESAIHQFAKRQMTWFRGMERRGYQIDWLDAEMSIEDKITQVLTWYKMKSID